MKRFICIAGFIVFLGSAAHADPITYQITLTATQVFPSGQGPGPTPFPPNAAFTPIPQLGDSFSGYFILDDSILATDGVKNNVPLQAFRIVIAGIDWDMLNPWRFPPNSSMSQFEGFRTSNLGFSSLSPTFIVASGLITEMLGAVYGPGDNPSVYFTSPGTRAFVSGDDKNNVVIGLIDLSPTPEPSTLLLLASGIGAMWTMRMVKRRR